MADTFKCACCRGTFKKGWTDEEADAEFATDFPSESLEESVLVCDDCYKMLEERFGETKPEQ